MATGISWRHPALLGAAALLSALASLGRVLFGPVTGELVAWIGWADFFVVTFVAALPGLWLVWRMRERIDAVDEARPQTT